MRLRCVTSLVLVGGLLAGSGCVSGAAAVDDPTENLLKQAVQAAQGGEFAEGIALAEKAVAAAPENREARLLLGSLIWNQADSLDKDKKKEERAALFHRSAEVFRRVPTDPKESNPVERLLRERSKLGEARAFAIEGKPQESLRLAEEMVAGGLDDLDTIENEDDLKPLRALPEYASLKAKLLEQVRINVAQSLKDNKSYPFDFALKGLDGKPVKLADYQGKVTIVDIWGTWCPPCKKEIPHFVDLYKEFHAKGLEIVGINCNEDDDPRLARAIVKKFIADEKIPYTCVLDDDTTVQKIPDFQAYPTTLFLDRTGKVRMTLVGYTARPKLEAIISTLLAEPATP